MRRIIVIVPDLLGEPSVTRQKLPTFERMAETGRLFKLGPLPKLETPEALFLGLKPSQGQLHQGPLTISALGADPPERSTHFHLSMLSFDSSTIRIPRVEIDLLESRTILQECERLNTKTLTIVRGEGLDHGLVWEGRGDMKTLAPDECDGKPIKPCLPEGDGEVLLRRFIDDSINLLSDLEVNQRRAGEDLPPLNLLWPWGHGVRSQVPNLALQRGEPALVISTSMRLQGLARLAGYRHVTRADYGRGTNTRLALAAKTALGEPLTVVFLDTVSQFRQDGKFEEAEWFVRELDTALMEPLFREALVNPTQILFLSPSATTGLGLEFETRDAHSNAIPFDERALEEKGLQTLDLWESVAAAL